MSKHHDDLKKMSSVLVNTIGSPNKAQQESKKLSPTSQKSSGHQSEESEIPNFGARDIDIVTGYRHKSLNEKQRTELPARMNS